MGGAQRVVLEGGTLAAGGIGPGERRVAAPARDAAGAGLAADYGQCGGGFGVGAAALEQLRQRGGAGLRVGAGAAAAAGRGLH